MTSTPHPTPRHLTRPGQIVLASLLAAAAIAGCHSAPPRAPDLRSGTWTMDLSPALDGSYTKSFVMHIDPPADHPPARPHTFTGVVYDSSSFDNGVILYSGDSTSFSFVSDTQAQLGGPYYWLGTTTDGSRLTGHVRSLARKFNQPWSAVPAKPAAPAGATK